MSIEQHDIREYGSGQQLSWEGTARICGGKALPANHPGHAWWLCVLTPQNMDATRMAGLSEYVYRTLEKGQETFIHHHDKLYFQSVLEHPENGRFYVGIHSGSRLVGLSFVQVFDNDKALQDEFPNHGLNLFSKNRNNGRTRVAVFGGDSVHPEYRGNHMNEIMVSYRAALATQMGATDFATIIDRANFRNMNPYFKNGFHLFSAGIDPVDNGRINLMHRPARETVAQRPTQTRAAYTAFDSIERALSSGCVGTSYNRNTHEITFAATDYYQTLRQPASPVHIGEHGRNNIGARGLGAHTLATA